MKKILITGSNGLLGQKIVSQLVKSGVDFIATSLGENRNPDCPSDRYFPMNITLTEDVNAVFQQFQPTHIIHTAAMTNVDQCETDKKGCDLLNVEATHILWEAAKNLNAHFQLLSTDFVFDGEKGNYSEEDKPNPLSYYGNSKLKAENILINDTNKNWSIVRTIIVYGEGNNLSRSNIVLWAKEALSKGTELNIIDDQFRAPTWADDLAWACIEIADKQKKGIYHIAGPETMSIFRLVERIAEFHHFSTEKLCKTTSSSLNQAAKRPPKTGFDISKAKRELNYHPKTLEETLLLLS
ncbi:MAG: SDR family oxidoreductase [Crocinitomicaceae bacterium]